MKKKIFIGFFVLLNSLLPISFVLANQLNNKDFNISLNKETIAKGYTVSTADNYLKLSLTPGILSDETRVLVEEIDDSEVSLPWNLEKKSSIIQFEFTNKKAYDNSRPFYIQMSYDEVDNNYKQVFFYDKNYNAWRPLPTQDFPKEKFVRSLIHLPYARLAVFSYSDLMTVGKASWYKYKGGNFAASPDFPAGSLIRVRNLDNNKYVDVKINDYGPDRSLHPDRVIDLDVVAFSKIANKSDGLINVAIEPLKIADSDLKNTLSSDFSYTIPQINSKSVIVIDESNGNIIYEKNADVIKPIASLTKIFSVYNFLNIDKNQNRLDEIITYNEQDEKYNLAYGAKWELALINLVDGDLLSIKDLIYSAMVRSANNAVESLVRVSGLNRANFITKVNSWAKENGATSFNIKEPTGLDKDNVSSARDLAKLATLVFKNSVISQSTITKNYSFKTRNDNSSKLRYNSSDLVLKNNYRHFKITGSKTGYLDEAGYCLITEAEVNGKKIIVVILDAESRSKSFSETIDLLNYAFYNNK
jgi:rare lipoprotein A